MRTTRLGIFWVVVAAGALMLSGAPAMAAAPSMHRPMPYTCTGGAIPSGNYASITVTGVCKVLADTVIHVAGNVNVRVGAVLDAQSEPSRITVGRNVTAAPGSLLGLGCQPNYLDKTGKPLKTGHPCTVEPNEHSTITVNGNVTAINANTVLLNGIRVKGNVTLIGGGGGPYPWSIKNNRIGRNLTVIGQTTSWLGVLFNRIGGNATLIDITVNDPADTNPKMPPLVFVVRNTIGRNLLCVGLTPGVSGGFMPGEVNVVGRHALGQCATLV